MKLASKSGATIAAAAATLFVASVSLAPVAQAQAGMGQCTGANACKGQSACKSGKSACKGQNACKGQGFSAMTKEQCAAAKGTFKAS